MRQPIENKNKMIGSTIAVVAFAAAGLAVPLKGITLEPSMMFLLGFGLIGLRIVISRSLNKMNRLPARTH